VIEGNDVICIDNLSSGSYQNIAGLLNNAHFCFIDHDICDFVQVDRSVDEVYNLACPASPPFYQKDPVHTLMTNVIGTFNMLELAKTHGAKILQASTSEVYGDPLQHPQREDYFGNVNPNGIRSCYDEGKRAAESLMFSYRSMYGVDAKIVRIFNTYGPNMREDDGRVVSNFIVQALQGRPITVYGDGEQTRSLCYIDDLVDGLIKMMAQPKEFAGPVNLGNPEEMTVLEIANKVIALTQSNSEILFKPLPSDDPKKRKPDITLAEEALKWHPTTKAEAGLAKTIEYFKLKVACN
jgi:UDP-glucuronate decarboxylase